MRPISSARALESLGSWRGLQWRAGSKFLSRTLAPGLTRNSFIDSLTLRLDTCHRGNSAAGQFTEIGPASPPDMMKLAYAGRRTRGCPQVARRGNFKPARSRAGGSSGTRAGGRHLRLRSALL